jgi:LysM repeat protein
VICRAVTPDGKYNAPMTRLQIYLPLIGFFICIGTGCAPSVTPTPMEPPDSLRPYVTPIPEVVFDQTPSASPQLVFASPTPLTYTVVQGDTLNGIAKKYGVSLDDLLAANPEVSATTLMIGTVLTIPTTPITTPVAGPTPVLLPFTRLDCWPSMDGGRWCFAALTNTTGDTLENLNAQISLLDESGNLVRTQSSMSMLDILPPGKSTALAAFFPAPIPAGVAPQAQLMSAVRILPMDSRYSQVVAENVLVNVDWSGRTAQVSGRVTPFKGVSVPEIPAGRLWLAATAYDATGRVVGVRRWESDSPMPAGGSLPFDFQISSMGPPIESVDLIVEARP